MNTRLVSLALATLLAAPAAIAVSSPQSAGGLSHSQQAGVFDLQFDGGNAVEYVDAIRRASTFPNITASPEIALIQVPPMTLRSVDTSNALRILEGMSVQDANTSVMASLEVFPPTSAEGAAVYVVHAQTSRRGGAVRQSGEVAVLSIRDLMHGGMSADDVLMAIETALTIASESGATPPELKFHEATGLVLARGGNSQMRAVHEVIDTLSAAAHQERSRLSSKVQVEDLQSALEAATAQTAVLEDQVRELTMRAQQMDIRFAASITDHERAQASLDSTTAKLRDLEAMRIQQIAKIDVLERELARATAEANEWRSRLKEFEDKYLRPN